MKNTSLVLLLTSLLLICSACSSEAGSFREKMKERMAEKIDKRIDEKHRSSETMVKITHGGLERKYLIHVPKSYNAQKPIPLLFSFHGGGGFMEYQADDRLYKLITKSEEAGFIVIFPNGYSKLPTGKFATWNAGNCCGDARDKNIDDVGFVKAIVAKVKSEYNIDTKKIFSTGMSNGGLMSYRLACEMADVFTAIAPVAGTDNTKECNPVRPVSVLHIHAQNDDRVLFNGGAGFDNKNKSQVTDFVAVPVSVAKWVKLNSCNPTPKRVLEIKGAYCDLYSACKNNVEVKLCVTENGKHSWPGGVKDRGDEAPSQAISANDMMWEFFNR